MTTRRHILKGLAATAAALILPPTLIENAVAVRRFWALDGTMVGSLQPVTYTDLRGELIEGTWDYESFVYYLTKAMGPPTITVSGSEPFSHTYEWSEQLTRTA